MYGRGPPRRFGHGCGCRCWGRRGWGEPRWEPQPRGEQRGEPHPKREQRGEAHQPDDKRREPRSTLADRLKRIEERLDELEEDR